MTAGTPAPQDAETVVVTHPGQCCANHCVVLVGERDEVGIHNVSHFMAGQISDLVSLVRAREVEAARREAWGEGYQAGMATEYAYREAPFGRDVTEPENPYRDLAATHAETEEG